MNNNNIIKKLEHFLLSEPSDQIVSFREWDDFQDRIRHFEKDLPKLRSASVLIPIVEDTGELFVLFTERARHMKNHAGQISFPGGGREGVETVLQTALREAEEEIGLPQNQVRPLGYLNQYPTISGFRVNPVVGIVSGVYIPKLQTEEVVSLIRVPLNYLLDKSNIEFNMIKFDDEEARIAEINYEGHRIWGATAGMVLSMLEMLTPIQSL